MFYLFSCLFFFAEINDAPSETSGQTAACRLSVRSWRSKSPITAVTCRSLTVCHGDHQPQFFWLHISRLPACYSRIICTLFAELHGALHSIHITTTYTLIYCLAIIFNEAILSYSPSLNITVRINCLDDSRGAVRALNSQAI